MSELDDEDRYIQADGLEAALIGFAYPCGGQKLAVYSTGRVLKVLMERDGMSEEDAQEFFDFNIAGAYIENGPIFVELLATVEDGYQALLQWKARTGKSPTKDPYGAVEAIMGAKGKIE